MSRNAHVPRPTNGKPFQPARRGRALALPLLALALSGCETLERMDYLDRFFESRSRLGPVAAVEPRPAPPDWAGPSPGPVVTAEPRPNPADWGTPLPGPVVAMEPRPDAASSPEADWRGSAPGSVVAMEPRPNPPAPSVAEQRPNAPPPAVDTDPEARTRRLVRQHQWLTRFWMELTPAQQARVEQRLRRGGVQLAAAGGDAAALWDPMGLADRTKLVFGSGDPSPERPVPPESRGGSVWAGSP